MSIIPEDPIERRRRLRGQQGSTFHQFSESSADDEAGGRFAVRGKPTVIGTSGAPSYPASALSGQPDAGPEPPLGYAIDDPDPVGRSKPRASRAGGAPSASPGDDVAAPTPSFDDAGDDDAA
jgi:hypothetical protein